jgi:hypothetical protein
MQHRLDLFCSSTPSPDERHGGAVAMLKGERIRFSSPRAKCWYDSVAKAFKAGTICKSAAGSAAASRIGRIRTFMNLTSIP